MSQEIPRIIHQVWLGPSPLPEKFARFQQTWRDNHPDWTMRFWTEESLPAGLRCTAIYERLRDPVERCDLLRLEAVWREGGVYVDCDFESLKPIDELLEGRDFFLAYIGPNRVNHALMGATPGHEILDRALTEVQPRAFHGYDKAATGPAFFNRILEDYPRVEIYPAAYFYPSSDEERAEAYAIHHAERSWQDRDAIRLRLDKAHRRIEKLERKRKLLSDEVDTLRTQVRRSPLRRIRSLLRRA